MGRKARNNRPSQKPIECAKRAFKPNAIERQNNVQILLYFIGCWLFMVCLQLDEPVAGIGLRALQQDFSNSQMPREMELVFYFFIFISRRKSAFFTYDDVGPIVRLRVYARRIYGAPCGSGWAVWLFVPQMREKQKCNK